MTEPEVTVPEAPVTDAPAEPQNVELSDADLRLWAKDNGIEGVPTAGKLSADWRDQILAAMNAATEAGAKPEEEAVVTEPSSEDIAPAISEEETEAAPEAVLVEEPKPYKAPELDKSLWVSGQVYTAGF